MEITLDKTWKEVLNILRGYEIVEATLEGNGDTVMLEEMNESHVVLVRAELHGSIAGDSELDRLGVNVEELYDILDEYGTPCQAELTEDDRIEILSQESSDDSATLSVVEPSQENSPDLDLELIVEVEGVDMQPCLRLGKRAFGIMGYHSTIAAENGNLWIRYWSEDTVKEIKRKLGEIEDGTDVSSRYHPDLLLPLKGEWNVRLGTNQPLEAEKLIDGHEEDWKANVKVFVSPKVENIGGS